MISHTPRRIRRVATENTESSMTDQSFKKDCDVNTVIARFKKTGQITHLARTQGVYADLSETKDLLSSIMEVQRANDAFMTLPSQLRAKLNNSPADFIEWINDPKNDEEAIKYGLKSRSVISEEVKEPQKKEKPNAKSPKDSDPSPTGDDPKKS